ncbi:hypothetical protein [Xanthobacter flavus]|uniref:hypothetical protein n=1 Tax=Xanthobacter flavus TaxID=281 RepID=UPI003728BA9E
MIGEAASVALGWLVGKVTDEAATRTAEGAIKRVLRKRADAAREIALQEIAAGREHVILDIPAQDEAVAILWRYLRAAEEGTARLNLRLMASILAGHNEAPFIHASEFLRWADLVTSLSEIEIVFLATLHRECLRQHEHSEAADEAARRCLIPRFFADEEAYTIAGLALVRTGLIVQISIVGMSGAGLLGGQFKTAPAMMQLGRIADLEGVLAREDGWRG